MISERCSCGASIKTDEPNPAQLVKDWRKNHACIHAELIEGGHAHAESNTQITMGFQPGEYPARITDPWEE